MKGKSMDRRDFLKKCLTATAGLGALSAGRLRASYAAQAAGFAYEAKGLPTRALGRTGINVPIIGFGAGSRFLRVQDLDQSLELLTYALDHGLYYWDTAHNYTSEKLVSEERLGLILKNRRREVFLATKLEERTYDGAMKQLELSLKRLQTDHLDICQVHSVESLEDVDKIGAKGGVLEALHKLREQKVARFIGFSGHADAEAMTAMVNRHDFDTMLIALNHMADRKGDFEKGAIPAAANKKMGVMVIKVIRPRETVEGIVPEELIRYAFSLEHVNSAVIGHDSLDVLKKNIELAKSFEKMTAAEMAGLETRLQPFFEGRNLPWLRPGYTDGIPA
jgi:predicted aldo/keto reductase-like oxidoreductase